VLKILPPPGFDPRTFQLIASRYTDYAIPAHKKILVAVVIVVVVVVGIKIIIIIIIKGDISRF
jgi:hypothetical protein